eukprot:TRINITY_DN33234_c0_g1_i1.p1 TRINITY_DN33234_c0_g1~~TRINITY_DN33234_c0_g1_i1.p1  ORF type:complete len:475 (+),score=126.79 TRINITY_DN33234_c0_g1_i1:191-1615(+)
MHNNSWQACNAKLAGLPGLCKLSGQPLASRIGLDAHMLNSDFLTQAGPEGLPPTLSQLHGETLAGRFILQVLEVADVSQPQAKRFKPGPENRRDPQPRRCFKVHFTDGTKSLFGVEHQPLREVDSLRPGAKVVLNDVMIRRGAAVLTPGSISVLGGEVQALVQASNTAKARILDACSHSPLFPQSSHSPNITQQQQPARQTQQAQPTQQQQPAQQPQPQQPARQSQQSARQRQQRARPAQQQQPLPVQEPAPQEQPARQQHPRQVQTAQQQPANRPQLHHPMKQERTRSPEAQRQKPQHVHPLFAQKPQPVEKAAQQPTHEQNASLQPQPCRSGVVWLSDLHKTKPGEPFSIKVLIARVSSMPVKSTLKFMKSVVATLQDGTACTQAWLSPEFLCWCAGASVAQWQHAAQRKDKDWFQKHHQILEKSLACCEGSFSAVLQDSPLGPRSLVIMMRQEDGWVRNLIRDMALVHAPQ